MKKNYLLWVAFVVTNFTFGQTSPGDIAFIAFNADGYNDFAFVTLVDIPNGNSIWFTDNEWTGTGFNNLNEGKLKWTADTDILAGSIIVINNLTVNVGVVEGGIDLNAEKETLLALLQEPTIPIISPIFLTGISNNANEEESGFLKGTRLTIGINFIDFNDDKDGYKYTGVISGEIIFSDYLPLIMNKSNWQIETTEGRNILPISTIPFSITTAGVVENQIDGFSMYPNPVSNGKFSITSNSRANKQVDIYSLLGKQVYSKTVKANQPIEVSNLNRGIYILRVEEEGKIATRKLVIE